MWSTAKSAAMAALIWCSGAAIASAQVVVLNARGPSAAAFPQGAVLPASRMISLKKGDRLEVLDAAGSHVLEGPFSRPAGQLAAGSSAALQDVFRRANASRPGIAAVRGFSLEEAKPPPPPEVPPLWRLDLVSWQDGEPGEPRSFCVMRGHAPVLTRGGGGAEGRLVIYKDATHQSRTVSWAAGVRDLSWPSDISFADGELFSLNLDDQGATAVRWRTVPPEATSLTALATALLNAGCYDQLDTLQSQVAAK